MATGWLQNTTNGLLGVLFRRVAPRGIGVLRLVQLLLCLRLDLLGLSRLLDLGRSAGRGAGSGSSQAAA